MLPEKKAELWVQEAKMFELPVCGFFVFGLNDSLCAGDNEGSA